MTREAKLVSGISVLIIPTIQYGGYFMLEILRKMDGMNLTDFQKSMFRAGHAHAGVLMLLALVAQLLLDHAGLSKTLTMILRIGFVSAAGLISAGFFFSAMTSGATQPNGLIAILYAGAIVLAGSLITTGVSLLRAR